MAEDLNVTIWRNLLKQGIDPIHVFKQACDHEGHLDVLPQSEDRDEAIRQTVAFIKELSLHASYAREKP